MSASNEYYRAAMQHLEECEAITGSSNLYDRVRIEIKAVTGGDTQLAEFYAQQVAGWSKDKNPYRIDLLLMKCAELDIEPTPTIKQLAAKVAASRFTDSPAGTPAKLIKDSAKHQLFIVMLNLIYAGASIGEAASKAAAWGESEWKFKPYKASTLQKDYEDAYKKRNEHGQTYEDDYFNNWDEFKTECAKKYWKEMREKMPQAGYELEGTRRR